MPRGNPNPRNLSDLVQAGGIDDAVDLRDRGYSGQRLRDKLSSLYPNAYHQSIRALADRSIAVRQSRNTLRESPPAADVSDVPVPLVPGAPAGVTVTFESTYTPEGAREPIPVRVHIEDVGRMTVGELGEVGAEFMDQSISVSASAYPRLEEWYQRQVQLAAQGDAEAAERLARFRGRIQTGDVKIVAVIRGT